MARRPFFSGNYQLGSNANAANLIAQAGAAQGQMFQNLGQTIGSSIEKFRENKVKKEREIASENQFLRMYDENPTSPIFQSFGIQNRDEAKAAAKDISKDPSLVNQAMMFAQNQMAMDANTASKQKAEGELKGAAFELGSVTGAVPPLGTISDPIEYAREARKVAKIENNPFLTQSLAKGIAPRVAAQQAINARGLQLTPGEESRDTAFAKEIVEFNEPDVRKGLTQLKEASKALGESDDLTGPFVGLFPKAFKDVVKPKASEVQEAVEEVVQRNLRLVLGAQFTEKEGERLISRAFNPRLEEAENKKRVERLIKSIEKAMSDKISQRDYFQRFGTLKGYDYSPVSFKTIENDFDMQENDGRGPVTQSMVDELKEKVQKRKRGTR